MKLSEDFDFKKFLEKIKLLEHIQKNNSCCASEIKSEFNISKSELYRKIDEWANEGLLIKDYAHKERKYYSHFLIRKTPKLKEELLSLYNNLIEIFSMKFKNIAKINQVLALRKNNPRIKVKSPY